MTKDFDPYGAVEPDEARRAFIANTLGGLHRRFVEDRDGGTVLMGRQCRLDTGHQYMVTRMFQPIDRRQVREQANWMLLLDSLGFDIKNQEGW